MSPSTTTSAPQDVDSQEEFDGRAAAPIDASTEPVDKSEVRMRRMFGEIAPRYDFLNHLLSLNVDHYWRWRTVRCVPPVGDAPVLDVCTGTGDLAFAYARRAPQTPVVASDFCPEMLDLGRQKSRRRGTDRQITWVEADSQALPFPSDKFQIVSVAFGLRNVTDTMAGLREMTRVCQPGGRVAVLEFSTPTWQPFRAVYGWYFRHVLPRIGQMLSRNREAAYNYLPESVGQFPQGEQLCQRLREAGLVEVTHRPLTFGVATLYLGRKPL
ncbi:MAG: bifunctional demethylmenaquinone methyltransferase/2-methoxy-6-polyprenyl-1,4-benzoquinol methylase UbiE [Planctomycetota bacterium]|nr:MAG: bifunctional demethylmenaquinone methyltransferase/2-methoxy-6-polyprenyl-1,4-benzoquinol methylase UbiE [Planctomycetota bacterium]REK43525.1 MAG: bifunctional demethylmenaquinone methyltransferase/2-methoxy-6-polyprenyl-1,4-benzoquinol methylase UbiE [Planctomycetota bacterium]